METLKASLNAANRTRHGSLWRNGLTIIHKHHKVTIFLKVPLSPFDHLPSLNVSEE